MFKKETLSEKNEAEGLMIRMREEQMPRLRAEFDTREAAKDVCISYFVRKIHAYI